MNDLIKIVLASGLFLLATSVYAQDDAEEVDQLGWNGVGEFGFVKHER